MEKTIPRIGISEGANRTSLRIPVATWKALPTSKIQKILERVSGIRHVLCGGEWCYLFEVDR